MLDLRSSFVLVVIGSLSSLHGCKLDHVDVDGGATGSSDSATDDEVSTTTPEEQTCPREYSCVEPAPEGWNGPIGHEAAYDDIIVPNCHNDYSVEVFHLDKRNKNGPLQCSCSCEPKTLIGCDEGILHRYGLDNGSCQGDAGSTYSIQTTCTEIGMMGTVDGFLQFEAPVATGGTCEPTLEVERELHPGDLHFRGCATADQQVAKCPDPEDLCMPDTDPSDYYGNFCIWKEGDASCPALVYTEQIILHRTWEDSRYCTECSCGEYSGGCGGTVRLYAESECGGALPGDPAKCREAEQPVFSARYGTAPTGDCEPSESYSEGNLVGKEPVTVCCMPRP